MGVFSSDCFLIEEYAGGADSVGAVLLRVRDVRSMAFAILCMSASDLCPFVKDLLRLALDIVELDI
jgi:hypothetical protein